MYGQEQHQTGCNHHCQQVCRELARAARRNVFLYILFVYYCCFTASSNKRGRLGEV